MEVPSEIRNALNAEPIEIEPTISEKLKQKLAEVPTRPGVYLHKNSSGTIIYVGKAKNLRYRLRSYFQEGRIVDAKTKAMVTHIDDFDFLVVDTEDEAFILEDNLIKKHKPKYNILLRDDKTYPYIKVTNEEFPKIYPTRKVIKDGSKYFGPYADVPSMKMILRIIRSLFFVRSCNLKLTKQSIEANKFKLCLDYYIHKCEGPCVGNVTREHYQENIKSAMHILQGRTKKLVQLLEERMLELSENEKFEQAAEIRDKLLSLQDFAAKQKIVSQDFKDKDVFGIARIEDSVCSVVFLVREGKVIGKKHFFVKLSLQSTESEIIQRTLETWYMNTEFIPDEVLLPFEPEDLEYLSDWIQKKFKQKLSFLIPQAGEKQKLVSMVNENAKFILQEHLNALEKREKQVPKAVLSLQRDLRLKRPPLRLECFDNSHIQGADLVSSLVVFEQGKPKKSEYRKFKNESVLRNDDYATMKEVVRRRYTRVLTEKQQLPDLIIIDGGKGQLNAAVEVLEELQILTKTNIIGLAKRLEEVFVPGEKDSILLPKASLSLRLLQQIRDEAHRFAITYHRKLREKRTLQTELTKIKGIGKTKAEKLLKHFGSVKSVREQSKEEISKVLSMADAERIVEYFSSLNE